ncbi:hypothetical protein BU24DRAFT_469266 [Aaosphaeria arxii CBS 175.79]|uniref:Uncharacterized protein n=1 Tax=Aaosphaeria arxii CBS 175.79 TaxID=1450172 RepID=A0A6A5Y5L9_9PLEO|nr:uncharacterized protein BU24DRAFT_469266 [Aaosphaeria arxii CBS 175.79]KAF2020503.1 hypothetical protein BU24DRAFT_469266 [Aaosphaeria arxii CBS 175.79]
MHGHSLFPLSHETEIVPKLAFVIDISRFHRPPIQPYTCFTVNLERSYSVLGTSPRSVTCGVTTDKSTDNASKKDRKYMTEEPTLRDNVSASIPVVQRFADQSVMNLGALTTRFVPKYGCTQSVYAWVSADSAKIPLEFSYFYILGPQNYTDCYPSDYVTRSDAYYSPGLCPSEWSLGCTSQSTSDGLIETQAICCPKYYRCVEGLPISKSWPCLSWEPNSRTMLYPKSFNNDYYITSIKYIYIHANGIGVRWREGDFMTTSTPSLGLAPTANGIPQTSTWSELTTSNTASVPTSPVSSSQKLSKNTYAGIGVGIGIATIGLSVIVFMLLRRRRRFRRTNTVNAGSTDQHTLEPRRGSNIEEAENINTAEVRAHELEGSPQKMIAHEK